MGAIIGVDPGVSGAIALLDGDLIKIYPMPCDLKPVYRGGKKTNRRVLNASALVTMLESIRARCPDPLLVLEFVQARPSIRGQRDSLTSADSFGFQRGVWTGVCAALSIRMEVVTPSAWKRRMGLLKADKDASRKLVCELFPQVEDQFAWKNTHDRAEALLIAEDARRRNEADHV